MTDVVDRHPPDPRPAAAVRLPGLRARAAVQRPGRDRRADARSAARSRASLILRNGAADEPADKAGPRSSPRGPCPRGPSATTPSPWSRRPSGSGAGLHADAGWDALSVGVEVPVARLEPALELLAELVAHPTFPVREVERLRDERLNDLLQARADPRRRVDEAFIGTIYPPSSPYHRPAGGRRDTVETLDPERPRRRPGSAASTPRRMTLDPRRRPGRRGRRPGDRRAALRRLGGGRRGRRAGGRSAPTRPSTSARRIKVLHRPGSVQTEIRIGHVGRAAADRGLPRGLGDERDPRRAVQLAPEHEAARGEGLHVRRRRRLRPASRGRPVLGPGRGQHRGDRARPWSTCWPSSTGSARRRSPTAELAAARDFLVGVFPLRFETPGPVVGALGGIVVHDLPDDELARYRARIEAVTAADVQAARRGPDPSRPSRRS